jgi:ubiquinone/menaquinone biosynthesis C-methylase UbiE
MMTDSNDQTLKQQVRDYWNAHPCSTQFTHLEWGSKQFFDEVERSWYDTQPFMRSLMEFDNFRGNRLLEIGCGLGTDLLQFARGGAAATGVDLTPARIELVKKRFALEGIPVDAHVASAENLPFPNASFDAVYSLGSLHHTPNTQKSVDEVYRVLKPGGRIITMLYHKDSIHVYLGAPLFKITHKLRAGARSLVEDWVRVYDGAENPLGKAYSKSELRKMFWQFKDLNFAACYPVRRKYPSAVNWLNQKLLSRQWGVLAGHQSKQTVNREQ